MKRVGLDRAEFRRRRREVPPFCLFFRRSRDVLAADVVLNAGRAVQTLRDGLHREIPDLLFILLDEDVLIPYEVMQLLLVILGQLLLILQLIFIHPLELVGPGALILDLCHESIDASLRVIRAVLAFILMDHVLILQHVSECHYLQLGALQLFVQVPLFRFANLSLVSQLGQLNCHVFDLLLVASGVELVGVQVQRRFIALQHLYKGQQSSRGVSSQASSQGGWKGWEKQGWHLLSMDFVIIQDKFVMAKQYLIVLLLVFCALASKGNKQVSTIVTGLWDIKRGELTNIFKRSFEQYLEFFKVLLRTESNLIIFGSKDLKLFVEKNRKLPNYVFIEREMEWFENMWHNPLIEKVRKKYRDTRADWNQMVDFPQYGLYLYASVVTMKPLLMRQALHYDRWNSDFYLWQDGGIIHSFPDNPTGQNVISPVNIIQKIAYLLPWHSNCHFYIFQTANAYHKEIVQIATSANYFILYTETMTDFAGAFENRLRVRLEEYQMRTEEAIIYSMFERLPYLQPIVNGIYEKTINHRFQVNTYFEHRTRSMRSFSFGRQFERVVEEMQGEKEMWILQQRKGGDSTVKQKDECRTAQREWLASTRLTLIKGKFIKYIAHLLTLLFLLVIVNRSNKQQAASQNQDELQQH